jgi:hypothetical protein
MGMKVHVSKDEFGMLTGYVDELIYHPEKDHIPIDRDLIPNMRGRVGYV